MSLHLLTRRSAALRAGLSRVAAPQLKEFFGNCKTEVEFAPLTARLKIRPRTTCAPTQHGPENSGAVSDSLNFLMMWMATATATAWVTAATTARMTTSTSAARVSATATRAATAAARRAVGGCAVRARRTV